MGEFLKIYSTNSIFAREALSEMSNSSIFFDNFVKSTDFNLSSERSHSFSRIFLRFLDTVNNYSRNIKSLISLFPPKLNSSSSLDASEKFIYSIWVYEIYIFEILSNFNLGAEVNIRFIKSKLTKLMFFSKSRWVRFLKIFGISSYANIGLFKGESFTINIVKFGLEAR